MRNHAGIQTSSSVAALALGLALAGCSGISLQNFGGSAEPPPRAAPTSLPSKYTPEEFIGRWGFTSYHKDSDRERTVNVARGQCRNPYVIARGPGGGVMMHLPDQREPSELRLKANSNGKNFIGPEGDAGDALDREILTFDGRVLITRYVDSDAANRYGNMVYVRCAPRS